jgi:hypothetical protein
MSTTREEILRTAMELSESDRLLLATELRDTVSDDSSGWSIDDPDLLQELQTRMNDGRPAVSWNDVKAQLDADLQA